MGYDDAPREQFEVTCADCGQETTVPFKPDGRRPVTCRDCFAKNKPPRRDNYGGGRDDRRERQDYEVTCDECGVETTVPFKPTGSRPVTCRDCFSKNRPQRNDRRGGDRGDREMFEVTCAECGVETTVPFKPTGDRPVKCRDCFQRDRPPRGGRDFGGRGGDRRERQDFEVTCADCGKQTTVPFKPTGSRPVKCRDCFRK